MAFTPPAADTVLGKIIDDKRAYVAARTGKVPERELHARLETRQRRLPAGAFKAALADSAASRGFGVIAEIKKASPSKGIIREDFLPGAIAADYAAHGADCVSVLTDTPYFAGEDAHLREAAQAAPQTPLLRKDFIIDPYQIKEAALLGADCILLIMAALDDNTARLLADEAAALGLDILAEIHDKEELDRALHLPHNPLIGVNNRDLKTLRVSLDTSEALIPQIPAGLLPVCESGVSTRADIERMTACGAKAFLIGEAFMRAPSPGAALASLLSPVCAGGGQR